MIRTVVLATLVSFVAPALASAAPARATAQHSCRAKKKKAVGKENQDKQDKQDKKDKKKDGKKPYGFEL
jgi:Ni/Co efflux regulator RcnB